MQKKQKTISMNTDNNATFGVTNRNVERNLPAQLQHGASAHIPPMTSRNRKWTGMAIRSELMGSGAQRTGWYRLGALVQPGILHRCRRTRSATHRRRLDGLGGRHNHGICAAGGAIHGTRTADSGAAGLGAGTLTPEETYDGLGLFRLVYTTWFLAYFSDIFFLQSGGGVVRVLVWFFLGGYGWSWATVTEVEENNARKREKEKKEELRKITTKSTTNQCKHSENGVQFWQRIAVTFYVLSLVLWIETSKLYTLIRYKCQIVILYIRVLSQDIRNGQFFK